jgi:hypothetical protein
MKNKSGFACHPMFRHDMPAHVVHHFLTARVLAADRIEHVIVVDKSLIVTANAISVVSWECNDTKGCWQARRIFILLLIPPAFET